MKNIINGSPFSGTMSVYNEYQLVSTLKPNKQSRRRIVAAQMAPYVCVINTYLKIGCAVSPWRYASQCCREKIDSFWRKNDPLVGITRDEI